MQPNHRVIIIDRARWQRDFLASLDAVTDERLRAAEKLRRVRDELRQSGRPPTKGHARRVLAVLDRRTDAIEDQEDICAHAAQLLTGEWTHYEDGETVRRDRAA